MGDFTPILVAVITSVATVAAAALGAGWLQRRQRQPAAAKWRDQAELAQAKAELMATENAGLQRTNSDLRTENADLRERLAGTQNDLDDCARQRDKAWSDLRVAKRGGAATS